MMNNYFAIFSLFLAGLCSSVKVDLYGTSLCPDTKQFIRNDLKEALNAFGPSIDFSFVPWGKTEIDSDNNIECQFGPDDCEANKVQSCAQDMYSNRDQWFQFTFCLYGCFSPALESFQRCATEAELDWQPINACYQSPRAIELQLIARDNTPTELDSIPWVVINGERIEVIGEPGAFWQKLCTELRSEGVSSTICDRFTPLQPQDEDIQHIYPIATPDSDAPFSPIVMDDNYAYLSGLVAADFPEGEDVLGDISLETTAVMAKISEMLQEIDLDMSRIVRSNVHLVTLDEFDAMDAEYRNFFEERKFPARTTTESGTLFGGSRVEITVIAKRRS